MDVKDIHQTILLEMLGLSSEMLNKIYEISQDNSSPYQKAAKTFISRYDVGKEKFDGRIFTEIRSALGGNSNGLRLAVTQNEEHNV